MNKHVRDAILRGVAAASEVHDAFRVRDAHASGLSPIDVFKIIGELDIPLRFQALDKLLGACVRISTTAVGILVTSRRDLHMQRFTAAHELGHFVLEHEGSMDREIRFPGHTQAREIPEVEADAFAAEFLMPKWLVKATAQRRNWWSSDSFHDPRLIYQLSLRLAASYEATCWALASHQYLDNSSAQALTIAKLKEIKQQVLREVELEDPWADVWEISSADSDGQLAAGPTDVFVLELDERSSAGFQWDPRALLDAGFRIIDDHSVFNEKVVGGGSLRRLVVGAAPAGDYTVALPLRRPFSNAGEGIRSFSISISTLGTRREDQLLVSQGSNAIH